MRNYASKSNARVTRFRTPSSFKVRKAQDVKPEPKARLPFQPPNRGRRGVFSK